MSQLFNSDIPRNSNDELSQDGLGGIQNNNSLLEGGFGAYLIQHDTGYNSNSLDTIQNNNSPSLNDVNTICNPDFNSMNIVENEEYINNVVFYNQKQKKDENIKSENNEKSIQCIELPNNNNNPNEDLNNNKEKKGRKKNGSDENGKHTKNSEDNIANKIKTFIINHYLINIILLCSINQDIHLKKLQTKEFISDLSKKNNENLFDKKISEILKEQPISTKYSTFDRNKNKEIVDKIYDENKEKNVIKILDLTYGELFIIFRRKLNKPEDSDELKKIEDKIGGLHFLEANGKNQDIEYFIENLKKKYEDEEYIEKVITVCLDFKNYFTKKNKRKSKKIFKHIK